MDNSLSSDSDRFLAVGSVTQSDRLVVELVQPPDTPAAILIKWPPQPTVTDPAKLTATIAAIVRVLGAAQLSWPRAARLGCSATAQRSGRRFHLYGRFAVCSRSRFAVLPAVAQRGACVAAAVAFRALRRYRGMAAVRPTERCVGS